MSWSLSSSIQSLTLAKKIPDPAGDWQNFYGCYTYVLLDPSRKTSDLDAALARMVSVHYKNLPDLKGFRLSWQKLTEICAWHFAGQ